MTKVIVYVCARQMEKKLSDAEDVGVAGIYQVELEDGGNTDIAGAALDAFHESVPVGMLDDFDFTVVDPSGKVVHKNDDYESYSYKGSSSVDRVSDLVMRCRTKLMCSIVADYHASLTST